ncbi:MAG: hypothetical protein AAB443_01940 [Patescibacteria group bacterium]
MDDNIAKNVNILIDELCKPPDKSLFDSKTNKIEVSSATSMVSTIYERIRNVIDFKDEHFIRRFAIQRFLRVYLSSKSNPEETSEILYKDLLRGKYINESHVSDRRAEEISQILKRYVFAKQTLNELRISDNQGTLWDFMLGVAASEIENVIDPNYKPEVFIKLMAQYILKALRGSNLDLSPEQEGIHVFIACHKALVRSDYAILRYHALRILYPQFFGVFDEQTVKAVVKSLPDTKKYVDGIIKSRTQEVLSIQVRKLAPPFKVLYGTLEKNKDRVSSILFSPPLLRDKADEFMESYYVELKKKLSLRITRTLIYLFITKMLLAILIEAPVDLYIIKHVNYISLAINTFFPVLLFFFIAKKITIPGRDNSNKIHELIHMVVYEDKLFASDLEEALFRKRLHANYKDKSWLSLVYAALYILVYGLIAVLLSKIGFNVTSIFLFYFFVSVLSFFAWNIRARSKDLQIIGKRDNVIEAILNVVALPILKVGQILSVEVARFNFFSLAFDLILEAPFKIIVQSIEDLIDFLKSKHEEVVEN